MKVISETNCPWSSAKPKAGDMNSHHARTAERMRASAPRQKPPSKVAATIAG